MPMESQGKFLSPQNFSGASQLNNVSPQHLNQMGTCFKRLQKHRIRQNLDEWGKRIENAAFWDYETSPDIGFEDN